MDFKMARGNRLKAAETAGPPQIRLLPADAKSGETRITADKFVALFDPSGQLSKVHGEANARVISSAPPLRSKEQPDRISTSRTIDAFFRPGSGVQVIQQQGSFAYTSGTQQAFAEGARYTPADQMIVLTGSPRIVDTGTATTARSIRLNRATGEGFAEGDVKTTYNDLKTQPGGALLAKSDPIHVTSQSMVARGDSNSAIYTGSARLWQDANVIEAPRIEFQKEQRTVIATSDRAQNVSTVLMSVNSAGKATAMNVTAVRLVYRDSERRARYDGGVTVRSADMTVTANQMDVFLTASTGVNAVPTASVQRPDSMPARLDKIVATGSVVITEPTRRGTGEQLTYTASDDKFVLTGGPPSIFDAEQGKITGVSLTLFRHDDRVVVEGNGSSPAVTHTRMER
jgi:lipopolysaccharide export system protein LptA